MTCLLKLLLLDLKEEWVQLRLKWSREMTNWLWLPCLTHLRQKKKWTVFLSSQIKRIWLALTQMSGWISLCQLLPMKILVLLWRMVLHQLWVPQDLLKHKFRNWQTFLKTSLLVVWLPLTLLLVLSFLWSLRQKLANISQILKSLSFTMTRKKMRLQVQQWKQLNLFVRFASLNVRELRMKWKPSLEHVVLSLMVSAFTVCVCQGL